MKEKCQALSCKESINRMNTFCNPFILLSIKNQKVDSESLTIK